MKLPLQIIGPLIIALSLVLSVTAQAVDETKDDSVVVKKSAAEESKSRPTPTPAPSPKSTPDEEEEEIRRNHRYLGEPVRGRPMRTTMFIGQEVAVPTDYSPARAYAAPDGRLVVQPATPRSFEVRKTGVTLDTRGGFEQTELEGFIDYGSPIRTVVPVYNEKGEMVGTAVQEHPNPILQPVFRTIRR